MTINFHTPIAYGADADDTVFNAPLGELDQAISDIVGGDEIFTGLKVGLAGAVDASAVAEIESITKGFLPPKMTEAQRDAIVSPATGLLVYNEDAGAISRYNGSDWGNYGGGVSNFIELIPETAFSGSQTLTISGISQAYQDLLFRFRVRRENALGGEANLRFNNASGASDYAWAYVNTTIGGTNQTNARDIADSEVGFFIPGEGAITEWTDIALYIRNYTKVGEDIYGDWSGVFMDGGKIIQHGAFQWLNGAAINRIDLICSVSVFIEGTYSLFGLGTA